VMMPRTNCTKAGGTPMSEKRFPSEPQMMLEADKRWAGRHSLRHHLSVRIAYRHGLRVRRHSACAHRLPFPLLVAGLLFVD
jgi:hypothetical protein